MSDDLCREMEPFIDPPAAPPPRPLPAMFRQSDPAAVERYAQHHAACHGLLLEIEQALGDLPTPDSGIPIHWGHAGSLAEAVTRLQDVKAWIEGIR